MDYNKKLDVIEKTIEGVDDLALLHVLQRRLGSDVNSNASRACYWLLSAIVDLHYKPSEYDCENAKECIDTGLSYLNRIWRG